MLASRNLLTLDPYYEISKRIKKTVLNQHEKAALQAATDEKKGPASKRNIARRSSTRTTNGNWEFY